MMAISTECHRVWLAAISSADLTEDRLHNVYVRSYHFVKGYCVTLQCWLIQ